MDKKVLVLMALVLIAITVVAITIPRGYTVSERPGYDWQSLYTDYNLFVKQSPAAGGFEFERNNLIFDLDFNKMYWINEAGQTKTISYYAPTALPIFTKSGIRFGYTDIYPEVDANIVLNSGAVYPSYRIKSNGIPSNTWDSEGKVDLSIDSVITMRYPYVVYRDEVKHPVLELWDSNNHKMNGIDFTTNRAFTIRSLISKGTLYTFKRPQLTDKAGMILDLNYSVHYLNENQMIVSIRVPREWLLDSAMTYPVWIIK